MVATIVGSTPAVPWTTKTPATAGFSLARTEVRCGGVAQKIRCRRCRRRRAGYRGSRRGRGHRGRDGVVGADVEHIEQSAGRVKGAHGLRQASNTARSGGNADTAARLAENPHFIDAEAERKGYGIADITP
jgi:hypothetical protein